jgi:exonuclease III
MVNGDKHQGKGPKLESNYRQLVNVGKSGSMPPGSEIINIRILLLNICGLNSKLKGVEFENMIKDYDIVFLTETKLSDAVSNSVKIPGFQLIPQNRKRSKAASGGVAALIKEDLTKYFVPETGNCEFVLWLKTTKVTKKELLIGVVYIPPANTNYSDINMFDELENDIVHLTSGKNRNTILFGDFNSRSAQNTDCLTVGDAVCEE